MTKHERKLQRRAKRKAKRVSNRIKASGVPSCFHVIEAEGFDSGFEIEAAAEGERKTKRFSMTAYTGGRLLLGNFPHPVVVDLSGIKAGGRSRPILRDHDAGRIVGHTTGINIEGGRIKLQGEISGANDHAREVQESAANGFPWQASIGARAEKIVLVDEGERVEVNGRAFTGPLYVARRAVLGEVSFVAMGADEGGATATVEAQQQTKGESMKFSEWLKAKGFVLASLSADTLNSLRAMFNVEHADGEDDVDVQASGENNITAGGDGASLAGGNAPDELDVTASQNEAAATNLERIAAIGNVAETFPTIRAKAIRENWSVERTELEVLRAQQPTHSEIAANGGADQYDAGAIEAALLMANGMDEQTVGGWYDGETMNAAMNRQYRMMTLHALMDVGIAASGERYTGSRKSEEFIRASFIADRELKASSGFSTLATTNILENVANKTLIAAYQAVETVWQNICAVRSASDFKALSRYRLDTEGAFTKVAADGELKHVSLTDAKYTNQVDTYGAMIALSRQDIVNDDLDAFLQIPGMLGRLSAVRIEEAVFVLLLSNPSSFFSAGNGNLLSGAGSALDIDSLDDAKQSFRDFVSDGKPILSRPQTLLVNTTLEQTGRNLLNESMIIATDHAASASTTAPARNPHAGTLPGGLQVTPYLNNTSILDQDGAAISGQSATQWYLFGDPNVRAAMTIAFLNGRRVPTIESAETDFNTLGMQWRGYHDFGVAMEETTAAVKSAGA